MADSFPDASTLVAQTTAHNRWPESKRKMSFGAMVPLGEASHMGGMEAPTFDRILELVRASNDAGVEIAWFADHFSSPASADLDRERGCWEAFTLMGALAGATRDLPIAYGPLVACATFRNPGLLARMTETLDAASNGKFILGLGAGWHRPEYDAYDYPFDHRVSRFEEVIHVVHQMLREGESTFEGRWVRTADAHNRPAGPRAATGGAPLLIGSSGDRMLNILARYADAWNTGWEHEIEAVRPNFEKLDAACRAVGRDPQSVVKTVGANVGLEGATGRRGKMLTGSDDEIVTRFVEFRDFGCDHLIVGLDPFTPEAVAHLGRLIAQVDNA
ncbi:MAG TPA: LLM class flavin-dependent oxidoreductase [Thermomicrobiales bacterium]|jgi:alkanesulfonate monooxygenase SsuD/methylene tetrahydromethanopterin reductase-like flavin-dependent oxidoreductase (luciferase family)|nr:LLM class flavin-dependent oxidoreductase [Thermomicrobiales bacterium]